MLRKNITISLSEYDIILSYARLKGYSFSEFLRKSAMACIEKDNELSLVEFINKNCEYVSDEEQREIGELNLDFDDVSGKELRLNDFL